MGESAGVEAAPSAKGIDLADRELFRHGVPHDLFIALRREAPI